MKRLLLLLAVISLCGFNTTYKNNTQTGKPDLVTDTMTATVGGAVPTPPNDATKFLSGAGFFTVPAGTYTLPITDSVSTTSSTTAASATAVKAANDNANTRLLASDYTAGTCTPTVLLGGTPVTSYTVQSCYYTKIGNRVMIHGYVRPNVIGAGTGAAQIGGLPYPVNNAANNYAFVPMAGFGLSGITTQALYGQISPGNSAIDLELSSSSSSSAVTNSNIISGAGLFFNFSYNN